MKKTIFIDGETGTTGLQIKQRLEQCAQVELIHLVESQRKNLDARLDAIKQADLAVLCLPDEAAKEIAEKAPMEAKILDSSSAHRTHPDWVYGMAELDEAQAEKIATAQRISNPGCYAICSIALLRPLVKNNILDKQHPITIYGLSGYTGGGKPMIADYQTKQMPVIETYSLTKPHKHLPEITQYSLLGSPPTFLPTVGNFPQGMLVFISIPCRDLDGIKEIYQKTYRNSTIALIPEAPDRLTPEAMSGRDDMELYVLETPSGCTLAARCDNLGKGAAGNALTNIGLMLALNLKKVA